MTTPITSYLSAAAAITPSQSSPAPAARPVQFGQSVAPAGNDTPSVASRAPLPTGPVCGSAKGTLDALACLAGDPLAFLQGIVVRSAQQSRSSANAIREISHQSRLSDLQNSIAEQQRAAKDSLISSCVMGAISIASSCLSFGLGSGSEAAIAESTQKVTKVSQEMGQVCDEAAATLEQGGELTSSVEKIEKLADEGAKAERALAVTKFVWTSGAGGLLAGATELAKQAEPFKHLANYAQIDSKKDEGRAEERKRGDDDAHEAAQAFKQAADSALQRMQKIMDTQHENRMIAIGRA